MNNNSDNEFAARVAGEVAFGPGEHAQKENAASAVKRTRRFVHLKMMEAALLGAIDVIESLPAEGRTIKVGIPDRDEIALIVNQMKKAIAGPPIEQTGDISVNSDVCKNDEVAK